MKLANFTNCNDVAHSLALTCENFFVQTAEYRQIGITHAEFHLAYVSLGLLEQDILPVTVCLL